MLMHARAHGRSHQVRSDEAWHLYEGGPLELLELSADGIDLVRHRIASRGGDAGSPVHTVKADRWQAARSGHVRERWPDVVALI